MKNTRRVKNKNNKKVSKRKKYNNSFVELTGPEFDRAKARAMKVCTDDFLSALRGE